MLHLVYATNSPLIFANLVRYSLLHFHLSHMAVHHLLHHLHYHRLHLLFSFILNLRLGSSAKQFLHHRSFPFARSLPSARQHPSYGDCLEVKREYYQNCSVLGCVTQCSQSAAHLCEQFLQVQQIRFVTLGPLRHA